MAVTILKPKSAYINIQDSASRTLQWQAITGQTAYEICYKRKASSSWSTLGKVTSTDTTFDLKKVYDVISSIDFQDLHYRVIVYYTQENAEGTLNAKEISEAFNLIFRPKDASGKLYLNEEEIPLFEDTTAASNLFVNDKKAIIADNSSALASENSLNGSKFITGTTRFSPTGIKAEGDFDQYVVRYSYTTEPVYRAYHYGVYGNVNKYQYAYYFYDYGGSYTYGYANGRYYYTLTYHAGYSYYYYAGDVSYTYYTIGHVSGTSYNVYVYVPGYGIRTQSGTVGVPSHSYHYGVYIPAYTYSTPQTGYRASYAGRYVSPYYSSNGPYPDTSYATGDYYVKKYQPAYNYVASEITGYRYNYQLTGYRYSIRDDSYSYRYSYR